MRISPVLYTSYFLLSDCTVLPAKSALLAGITAQLFTFFTDPSNYTKRANPAGAFKLMIFLCYTSMIFNTSATVTSFMIIARLHRVPYRGALGEVPYPKGATVYASRSFLLTRYGFGTVWLLILWHCASISISSSNFDFSSDKNIQGVSAIKSVYGPCYCKYLHIALCKSLTHCAYQLQL